MPRRLTVLALLATAPLAVAQTPAGPGAAVQPELRQRPAALMQEYLALLEQIAPAAREGAQSYLQAYAQRCGRNLEVGELHRLLADGAGDPVLMRMMGAAHADDRASIARLAASIDCRARR